MGPGGTEADLALSRSLLLSNTNTHTQTLIWTGTNPSPEASLCWPGEPRTYAAVEEKR